MNFTLFKILLLLSLFFYQAVWADVQINNYKKNHSWINDWNTSLKEELKKDQYTSGSESMLNIKIDEGDLSELGCVGYNKASIEEKSDFWIVFFSSLARAESAFNPKAISPKSKGSRSYGLLQLAKLTAKNRCDIDISKQDILVPEKNLICGLKLMNWQLHGAPVNDERKLRADLEGKIFGKYIFQWGPLRQNDHRGRSLLVNWFKSHLDQMKFCNQ